MSRVARDSVGPGRWVVDMIMQRVFLLTSCTRAIIRDACGPYDNVRLFLRAQGCAYLALGAAFLGDAFLAAGFLTAGFFAGDATFLAGDATFLGAATFLAGEAFFAGDFALVTAFFLGAAAGLAAAAAFLAMMMRWLLEEKKFLGLCIKLAEDQLSLST